jgi:hypothetical protein
MEKSEIRAIAVKAFCDKYPEDTDVTSTDVVQEAFGGALAVVRSKEKNGNPNEEIVYVSTDRKGKVFPTTEDMAAFLEQKARKLNVVDIMSNNAFNSGCVFVFLIVAVFIAGFAGDRFSKEAFAALSGILGTAAGFFFGTRRVA